MAELHLLWDLCGGSYAAGPNWPLDAKGDAFIESEAKRLMKALEAGESGSPAIQRKDILLEVKKPATQVGAYFTKIRDESHAAAGAVAYTDIEENKQVSDAYLAKVVQTAARRVALGGFRLQGFLERMYDAIHHTNADGEKTVFA